MATIGTIKIDAVVDTTGVAKGTQQVLININQVQKAAEQGGSKLAGLGAAITGALSVGAVAAFAKSGMDAINTTRQMAERLGESTEAFSKLSYAAKLADVDQESLSGALQKLNQNLGEAAATGEGKTAEALNRLGLSAQTLASGGVVDAFKQITAAVGAIQNPAERARTAVELFGKSGQGMLNLVAQGADGIAALEAEAVALGLAFDDVDAARIDEADDALTRIWASVGGVAQSLAIELAPWITEVSTRITEWAKTGVDSGSFVSQAVDWVGESFAYAADAVQILEAAFYGVRAGMLEGLSYIVSGIDKLVQAFAAAYEYFTGTRLELGSFLKTWSEELDKAASADMGTAMQTWGEKWRHENVRQLVDEVNKAATDRAVASAGSMREWQGGRASEVDQAAKKKQAEKFSVKAAELGSSEAASTILASRFGRDGAASEAKATANHTKRTADLAAKQLEVLQEIAAGFGTSEIEVWDMMSKA